MKRSWWDRWWESVADRGRELLNIDNGQDAIQQLTQCCHALMRDGGEALGTALAREIVQRCEQLDAPGRDRFLEVLQREFAPDRQLVRDAANRYLAHEDDLDAFLALSNAVEPPRQELMRRINRAYRGTAMLVALREHLLGGLREHADWRAVDADFRHLFSSWFNRGFLQLRRIDWHSPAVVLEKLISYEAVHAIQGWGDLRRRLADDRRCFAFFHPALPDEPLIFVEVALVEGMPDSAAPLLSLESAVINPKSANTAVFFSINNCRTGLRGISFGNFLIKQVMAELQAELPWLTQFVTLSPLPRFAANLRRLVTGQAGLPVAGVSALIGDHAPALCRVSGLGEPGAALLKLLDEAPDQHRALLEQPLRILTLYYLTQMRQGKLPLDPVAGFHLANGARLERINPFADNSPGRIADSFGVMVNYLYDPAQVEANHEGFVAEGTVALSRGLQREARRVEESARQQVLASA